MRIKDIICIITDRKKEIEKRISELKSSSDADSVLRLHHRRGRIEFYAKEKESNRLVYISKSDIKSLRKYSKATYYKKMIVDAQEETKSLDECLHILENATDMDLTYDTIPDEIKNYVDPNCIDDEYAIAWQSRKFTRMLSMPTDEFITDRGEKVRSKIELIIANKLNAKGIPYIYEKPLKVGKNEYLNPDFTILNKRTRKVFIWEHFGKMDDEEYNRKNLCKLESYAKAGYIFGKNLIATFESKQKALSTTLIDKIIKELFL